MCEAGFKQFAFECIKALPFVRGAIKREKEKAVKTWTKSLKSDWLEPPITKLPLEGWKPETVKSKITEREKRDVQIAPSSSSVSGTVYMAGGVVSAIGGLVSLMVWVLWSIEHLC